MQTFLVMKDEKPIKIREIYGAEILDSLSCSAIAERFFNRSRAWFTQRLNNNIVNGKPISFTPEELFTLRSSLREISTEINNFCDNIPNLPTPMSIQVYVVTDKTAIQFIEDNDIDGFKGYLAEEEYLYFAEPETFDTEAEALAFCAGIGFGTDERAPVEKFPLRTSVDIDLPFIEAIKEY